MGKRRRICTLYDCIIDFIIDSHMDCIGLYADYFDNLFYFRYIVTDVTIVNQLLLYVLCLLSIAAPSISINVKTLIIH